jgi:hypothetical protein
MSAATTTTTPSLAVLDTMTRIIMSQTEMTEEETRAALERTNYDLKRVIREYMSPSSAAGAARATATATATSTNQLRFAEIRNFMDKSAEDYYRRQEYAKIYNQVLERKKAEAAAAAAAAAAAGTGAAAVETETSKL